MDPHYKPEQTKGVLAYPSKVMDEKKVSDLKPLYSTIGTKERTSKPYGEATKLYDATFMKTGLRK